MLENSSKDIVGVQLAVYVKNEQHDIRVPIDIFSEELIAYMRFRLKIPAKLTIQRLPIRIQNLIRMPIDAFMGEWIGNGSY